MDGPLSLTNYENVLQACWSPNLRDATEVPSSWMITANVKLTQNWAQPHAKQNKKEENSLPIYSTREFHKEMRIVREAGECRRLRVV